MLYMVVVGTVEPYLSMISSLNPNLVKKDQNMRLMTYSLIYPIMIIWYPSFFQEGVSPSISDMNASLGRYLIFIFEKLARCWVYAYPVPPPEYGGGWDSRS